MSPLYLIPVEWKAVNAYSNVDICSPSRELRRPLKPSKMLTASTYCILGIASSR